MKIEVTHPITKSQDFETTKFSIEASPWAFQILTRQLYKNPVASIIRELTSNAIDAHRRASTMDLPITITLPTYLDATFSIEDQGTGLSPDQIQNIYSVFFGSDKRNSNNELGGYGLGAKTPLAYNDQFILTSRFKGTEYQYIVLINTRGIPELNLVYTNPTLAHDGLKIQVPTNPKDQYKWRTEAENILPYFNIDNLVVDIELPKTKILLEGDTWKITNSKSSQYLAANIGGVIYPIDLDHIQANNELVLYNIHSTNANLILNFPIGTLSITPNREDLSYTNDTIEKIKAAYLLARAQAHDLLNTLIHACPTYEDACIKYQRIATVLYNWRWATSKTLFHPSEPEQAISPYIELPTIELQPIKDSHRCKYPKLNGYIARLNLNHNYQLWYCPPKTKHIKERLAKIPFDSNYKFVFFKETEQQNITQLTQLLQPLFGSNITYHDLTTLIYTPPKPKSSLTTQYKTLSNPAIYPFNPSKSWYYLPTNGDSFEDLLWPLTTVLDACQLLGIERNSVILLPKSKRNIIQKHNLIHLTPILKEIPRLIHLHAKELSEYQIQQPFDHDFTVVFAKMFQNHDDEILRTDIQALNIDHSPQIRLLHSLKTDLGINIPPNTTYEEKLKNFYEKYRCLIDNRITDETLITAYLHYISEK